MSSTTTLSAEECQAILLRWKESGVSTEEREEFVDKALALLADETQSRDMASEIVNIAQTARDVYRTFDEVLMWWLNPSLVAPWVDLKFRYLDAVRHSIGMASTTVDVLNRFDEVYMAKVEVIQTEQDRLDAIALLEPFVVELETNDEADRVSREFLELKRDVEAFINALDRPARDAAATIIVDIQILEEQIKAAQKAIAGSGFSMVAALGLGARASPVIASLKDQREKKAESLASIRKDVAVLNGVITPQPAVQATPRNNEIPTPDIAAMLDGLMVFAELWSGIRSQTVQFNTHLKGGLAAATNSRFRAEVRLAREESRPLQAGLKEYIKQLEIWA